MPGKTASRHKKGSRGLCTYCNIRHRKGRKNGERCPRGMGAVRRAPKPEQNETLEERKERVKTKAQNASAVARRKAAKERQKERDKRTNQEQYDLLVARGYADCDEAHKLITAIAQEKARAEKAEAVKAVKAEAKKKKGKKE